MCTTKKTIEFILCICICTFSGIAQYKSTEDFNADNAFADLYSPKLLSHGDDLSLVEIENPRLFYPQTDTTQVKKSWAKTDTGTSLIISAGLIGLGLYTYKDEGFLNRKDVKDVINRYLPNYENPIDDYIQYLPYVATFALDPLGIESKHTAMRKLSTTATAIGLNLIVIQGLKYSIAEPRPDNSGNNSFPSGHTATAFTGAHLLHKEYRHKSPFISIAGYTLASMTGVLRQLNNRHWISDVLVSAGLGISLVEFAYFLNDRWWDEKGINEIIEEQRRINTLKPSFVGVKAGFASLTELRDDENAGISAQTGFRISFEGAYFFNRSFGLGGEIGFQSFPQKIDQAVKDEFQNEGYEIIPQAAGNRMYYVGPHYQFPFGKNAIGTKFLLGAIAGPNTEIFLREFSSTLPDGEIQEIIYARYTPYTNFSWATGIYYKRVVSDNISLSVYFDYNNANSKYDLTYLDRIENGTPIYAPTETSVTNWNSYSVGASLNIMLW